jgi:hypothetical protein
MERLIWITPHQAINLASVAWIQSNPSRTEIHFSGVEKPLSVPVDQLLTEARSILLSPATAAELSKSANA